MSYDSAAMARARLAGHLNYAGNWGPIHRGPVPGITSPEASELIAALLEAETQDAARRAARAVEIGAPRRAGARYGAETIVHTSSWTLAGGGNDQRAFARYAHPVLLERIDLAVVPTVAANTTFTGRLWRSGQYPDDPTTVTVDEANGWIPLTAQDYFAYIGDLGFFQASTNEQTRTILLNLPVSDPQTTLAWNFDNGGANPVRFAVTVHARRLSGDPVEVPIFDDAALVYRAYSTPRAPQPRPAASPIYPSAVRVSVSQAGRILNSKIVPWVVLDANLKAMVLTNAASGIYDPNLQPMY